MSYIKATKILPVELLEKVQEYIDGEYIYIPKKEDTKKAWGDNTNTKNELAVRNNNIYKGYRKGLTVRELAVNFYLSEKSIQRIVLNKKKENQ